MSARLWTAPICARVHSVALSRLFLVAQLLHLISICRRSESANTLPAMISLDQLSPSAPLPAPRVTQWLRCEKAVRSALPTYSMEGQITQLMVGRIRGRALFWRGRNSICLHLSQYSTPCRLLPSATAPTDLVELVGAETERGTMERAVPEYP